MPPRPLVRRGRARGRDGQDVPADAAGDRRDPRGAHGRRVLAVAATYDGPAEEGEAILAPLHAYAEPLVAFFAQVPSEVVAELRELETTILS